MPLADTFPDPAGGHFLSLALFFGFGQSVRGGGCVVIWHEVPVVCHEVSPQLVKVLHRVGQEKLHAAEDVQQCLRGKQ